MSWVITGSQPIPAVIGEPFGGGYFAGYISHTADGNPTHALIVAPRGGVEPGATGTGYTLTDMLQWKLSATNHDVTSLFNGYANTQSLISAGIADFPAAEFCVNLSIGGYTDWYLPARYELEIAYFNLKPSTGVNTTSFGANPYSVPRLLNNYTANYPLRTFVPLFAGGSESFVADWHTSSSCSGNSSWWVRFSDGLPTSSGTGLFTPQRVRAFRRIAL